MLLNSKKGDHSLYACSTCELRRFYPIPDSYIMEGMYENIANTYNEEKATYSLRSAQFYLDELNKLDSTFKRKTVLDIGCGLGYYSNAFGKLGMDVTVVEPDKVSADFCEKHQKHIRKIIRLPLEDYLQNPTEKYDIIYCRHVIEHFNKPLETFENLKNVCHANTLMILETDNNNSSELLEHPEAKMYWVKYYMNNYEVETEEKLRNLHVTALGIQNTHYYAYNQTNLTKLFKTLGFDVVSWRDYHLGNYYLWPNMADYSTAKVFLRFPKYLLYLPDVLKYRKRIKEIQGNGMMFITRLSR
jgi:2-polyprenyl-3-methyl-5-hydroxy-6-metoxy-1,4-benzoquinol methylase